MENIKNNIISFIKDYVAGAKANGVILGMSGGKDSLIVASLCVNAIGKENVLGVIMPNGAMKDMIVAKESCELLGIDYNVIDIENTYDSIINNISPIIKEKNHNLSTVTTYNVPPRIRMTTLYAIAGSLNYLVANTSNLSEKMVGYTTKWGDNIGDFAPLLDLTKTEVCELGISLGLPKDLVYKTPDDGLTGKTDEDNLGITYNSLDNLIRYGKKDENYEKIISLYKKSSHKRNAVPYYRTGYENYLIKDNK